MVSISTRIRWDGSTAYSVRWRELGTRRQRRLTVHTEFEAHRLTEHLREHGQPPDPESLRAGPGILTVAEVVQEHIDFLVRPSRGTVATYQRILDLHIRTTIGLTALDDLGYRDIVQWIKSLIAEGVAPKSIHSMHGLLSASMNTAELLQYIARNPCRGIQLPTLERAEDEGKFLTPAEFRLVLDGMDERYKTFVQFLVMTGTRFGEATAIQVADIDLASNVQTARINKAWKRDDQSGYYIGPTKTGAGKRTIGINRTLANLLHPLLQGRAGNDLLFTAPPRHTNRPQAVLATSLGPSRSNRSEQRTDKVTSNPRPATHPCLLAHPRRSHVAVLDLTPARSRIRANNRTGIRAPHASSPSGRRGRHRAINSRIYLSQ